MRVSNCINCNEYKYLEKDGKCRECLNKGKIYVGNHNNKKIFIDKSNIYENISIFGMIGSGKTTLQKHLATQILDKNHGLCYIDIHSEINKNNFTDMNMQNIKLGQNETINLLDTVRQRGDINYTDEVNTITNSIMEIILEYTSSQKVKTKSLYLLENILRLVIDSKSMNLFSSVYECLMDESIRRSAINNKSDKITISNNIKHIKMEKYDTLAHMVEQFSSILDNRIIDNSNINIKDVISNSEKLIFDFSHIQDNRPLISSFIIKKLFTEVSLQDKSKFLFCVNKLDRDSIYASLETEYKQSKQNNACFISTANMPAKVHSKLLNLSNIQISFKLSNKIDINSKMIGISPNQISSLSIYEFILKTSKQTTSPVKLDL